MMGGQTLLACTTLSDGRVGNFEFCIRAKNPPESTVVDFIENLEDAICRWAADVLVCPGFDFGSWLWYPTLIHSAKRKTHEVCVRRAGLLTYKNPFPLAIADYSRVCGRQTSSSAPASCPASTCFLLRFIGPSLIIFPSRHQCTSENAARPLIDVAI